MNHPVLRVKKGVPLYDDSQEEREPPRREPTPAARRRMRPGSRRRRGGLTFLPLLVLALALVFVFRVMPRKPPNTATLAGWDLVLRAAPHEGALLVGVTFTRSVVRRVFIRSEATPVPEPPQAAVVTFSSPQTAEKRVVTDSLVRSPFTVHARMLDEPPVNMMQAEVDVGGQKRLLAVTPLRVR
jgi:hypothetical protein